MQLIQCQSVQVKMQRGFRIIRRNGVNILWKKNNAIAMTHGELSCLSHSTLSFHAAIVQTLLEAIQFIAVYTNDHGPGSVVMWRHRFTRRPRRTIKCKTMVDVL